MFERVPTIGPYHGFSVKTSGGGAQEYFALIGIGVLHADTGFHGVKQKLRHLEHHLHLAGLRHLAMHVKKDLQGLRVRVGEEVTVLHNSQFRLIRPNQSSEPQPLTPEAKEAQVSTCAPAENPVALSAPSRKAMTAGC